jgi:predicted PurR-regulated permease PerM
MIGLHIDWLLFPVHRTARNIFVVSLAISDFCLCLLTMPLTLVGWTVYTPFVKQTQNVVFVEGYQKNRAFWRIWPLARDNEATPAVNYVYTRWETFEDEILHLFSTKS